jgi:hypothetical protein
MFQGGDIVVRRASTDGLRGMVLGYEDCFVMVCWEIGYSDFILESEDTIELVDALDLMVEAFDGKETKFRYGFPR